MLRARCGLRKALASETRSTKTARRAHSTLHNEQVIRSDARSQDLSPAHSKEFEKHIRAYIRTTQPTEEALLARQQIIRNLEDALAPTLRNGVFKLEQFGSTIYGVDSSDSDIDLVLTDRVRFQGFRPDFDATKLPKIYKARYLAAIISRAEGVQYAKFVPAVVPIVKALCSPSSSSSTSPSTTTLPPISVDININDRLGLYNSRMIQAYTHLSPLLVPMLYWVKRWAKSHGLNYPGLGGKNRSLSSYCYALMCISYLQHLGHLPNIQDGFDELIVSKSSKGAFWIRNKKDTIRTLCDVRYRQALNELPERRELKEGELGDAVYGWFKYWGENHQYEKMMASIRKGGIVPRELPLGTRLADAELESSSGALEEPGPEVEAEDQFLSLLRGDSTPATKKKNGKVQSITYMSDLNGPEPSEWSQNLLVVPDPFIRTKNVGGNVTNAIVEKLRSQCAETARKLREGKSSLSTLGDTPSKNQPQNESRR